MARYGQRPENALKRATGENFPSICNNFLTCVAFDFRVYRGREAGSCFGYPVRGFQEQEMGVQLERKCPRAHNVQVFGALRRAEEVAHCQGGALSVSKPIPIGKRRFAGKCNSILPTDCRGTDGSGSGTVATSGHRHRRPR